jgi:hypothetical protein
MTYADHERDIPPKKVSGELSRRWIEVWQNYEFSITDSQGNNVQVDPETIVVVDDWKLTDEEKKQVKEWMQGK